jgi:hypothetical protein
MDKSKINMHKRMAMGMKPKKMAMGAMALGALGAMAAKKMMGKKSGSTDKIKGGMGKMLAGLAMKKKKELAMGKMGGGMMKRYSKGGGADSGRMGEMKSRVTVGADIIRRMNKKRKEKLKAPDRKPMKPAAKGRMGDPAKRITGARPNRPINPSNPGFPFKPRPRPIARMGGGVAEAARRVRASEMKKGGLKAVDKEKNPGLAKLPTRVRNKMGYMKRGGKANTRRMNRLEELGRVDAEKAKTRKGARNLRSEKRRIVRELKK